MINLEFLTDEQVLQFTEALSMRVGPGFAATQYENVVFKLRQLGIHDIPETQEGLLREFLKEKKERAF
jgi:hypothetical protein